MTPEFYIHYHILLITADKNVKGKKPYDIITDAMIGLDKVRENGAVYAASADPDNSGGLYVMYDGENEETCRQVRSALGEMKYISFRRQYAGVPDGVLCDLMTKYRAMETLYPEDKLQRKRGVIFRSSDRMVINVTVSESDDGSVVIDAAGKNIKKYKGKPMGTKKRHPFTFSAGNVLVYPVGNEDTRDLFIWKDPGDGENRKSDVIRFGSSDRAKTDFESSGTKFAYMHRVCNWIRGFDEVELVSEVWEGNGHDAVIDGNEEKTRDARKRALADILDKGIKIKAEKRAVSLGTDSLVRCIRTGMNALCAPSFSGKAVWINDKAKIKKVVVDSKDAVLLRTAKKDFMPDETQDMPGKTVFSTGKSSVSGVTIFMYSKKKALTAFLYDENGDLAGQADLKRDEGRDSLDRSPFKRDGKYLLHIIEDRKTDAYETDLLIQHVTKDVIKDNAGSILAVCENIMWQFVIKGGIDSGRLILADIPEYRGYEFIYSDGEHFVSMKMTDGEHFTVSDTSETDIERIDALRGSDGGQVYAVKTPDDEVMLIRDTGFSLMPSPDFDERHATRTNEAKDSMDLAPFLDYVWYENENGRFYTAGWDLKGNGKDKGNKRSYSYWPQIRQITAEKEGKIRWELFFSKLLDVCFVRMSQENTVVPFPYKYLREYAASEKGKNKENTDVR